MGAFALSEKNLAIISLFAALFGISVIFLISQADYSQASIPSLKFLDENSRVSFYGRVNSVSIGESYSKLLVCSEECISVSFKNSLAPPRIFSKGDIVFVKGTVSEYKNSK